jgi:hypothetical protein
MYVCVYVWMYVRKLGMVPCQPYAESAFSCVCVFVRMHVCMYVCVYVCKCWMVQTNHVHRACTLAVYVCMYACMC